MQNRKRFRQVTNSQIKRLEAAIAKAELDGPPADIDPRLHEAMLDGIRSQLEDLRKEVSAAIEAQDKSLLNIRETAEQLGVHENTIRNWANKQLLHCVKLPGSGFRRFPREEVERMRKEIFGSYAPATELPNESHTGVRGQDVLGDIDG